METRHRCEVSGAWIVTRFRLWNRRIFEPLSKTWVESKRSRTIGWRPSESHPAHWQTHGCNNKRTAGNKIWCHHPLARSWTCSRISRHLANHHWTTENRRHYIYCRTKLPITRWRSLSSALGRLWCAQTPLALFYWNNDCTLEESWFKNCRNKTNEVRCILREPIERRLSKPKQTKMVSSHNCLYSWTAF